MKTPNIKPVWGNVMILPDDIEETDPLYKKARAVGLELPQTEKDKIQHTQTEGTLVGAGGNAFENWMPPIPQVGDKIIYNKYAGFTRKIRDTTYQIMSDTDIHAIIGDENE